MPPMLKIKKRIQTIQWLTRMRNNQRVILLSIKVQQQRFVYKFKEDQVILEKDQQNQDQKDKKFKHFSDYVTQSNKAQKDFIVQFMEINELEQYQARFLIMSLLAVFTVAICCFGVKYILNFSKTCKTALSELKWMKEVENQQDIQSQNVFTEY